MAMGKFIFTFRFKGDAVPLFIDADALEETKEHLILTKGGEVISQVDRSYVEAWWKEESQN